MQSRTAAEEQMKSNIRRLVGAFYFVVLCSQADVKEVGLRGAGCTMGRTETNSGTCRRVQQSKAAQRLQTAGLELSLATYECQNEKRKQIVHTYTIYKHTYIYISSIYICIEVGREVGRIIIRSEQAKVFTFDCISFALWESITN